MTAKIEKSIPYKIYLSEEEMPKAWYNLRSDMKVKPAPLLNPGTGKPMTAEELSAVFCEELVQQELDNDTREIPIPQEILDFYKMYRPSPLTRAYCLEKKLNTPAKIYYKFEGNNTSGSHKLNSAIAQAYYAKNQGLKGVTTETGAGQWGTALSMACAYLGLDCHVYMVKVSYEQKPFRREVMRTYGAQVTPSPSETTNVGRQILKEHPGTGGSLGCAISEAVEDAKKDGIHGKATTPYLLAKIKDLTGGDSLDSNIQLVFNNARLGAAAAVELAKLEKGAFLSFTSPRSISSRFSSTARISAAPGFPARAASPKKHSLHSRCCSAARVLFWACASFTIKRATGISASAFRRSCSARLRRGCLCTCGFSRRKKFFEIFCPFLQQIPPFLRLITYRGGGRKNWKIKIF